MQLLTLNKLDKNVEYFISTKMKMATFMGKASNVLGILIVDDIVVGSKEVIYVFFCHR